MGYAFHTRCLQMIPSCFVMLVEISCCPLGWLWPAFNWFESKCGDSEIVLVGEVGNIGALATILQCRVGRNTWECRWVLHIKQHLFGILFWRGWRRNSQVGSIFIYQRVVDLLYWRVLFLAFLRTIYPYLPSL